MQYVGNSNFILLSFLSFGVFNLEGESIRIFYPPNTKYCSNPKFPLLAQSATPDPSLLD